MVKEKSEVAYKKKYNKTKRLIYVVLSYNKKNRQPLRD